jgi:hypothetical protein
MKELVKSRAERRLWPEEIAEVRLNRCEQTTDEIFEHHCHLVPGLVHLASVDAFDG